MVTAVGKGMYRGLVALYVYTISRLLTQLLLLARCIASFLSMYAPDVLIFRVPYALQFANVMLAPVGQAY